MQIFAKTIVGRNIAVESESVWFGSGVEGVDMWKGRNSPFHVALGFVSFFILDWLPSISFLLFPCPPASHPITLFPASSPPPTVFHNVMDLFPSSPFYTSLPLPSLPPFLPLPSTPPLYTTPPFLSPPTLSPTPTPTPTSTSTSTLTPLPLPLPLPLPSTSPIYTFPLPPSPPLYTSHLPPPPLPSILRWRERWTWPWQLGIRRENTWRPQGSERLLPSSLQYGFHAVCASRGSHRALPGGAGAQVQLREEDMQEVLTPALPPRATNCRKKKCGLSNQLRPKKKLKWRGLGCHWRRNPLCFAVNELFYSNKFVFVLEGMDGECVEECTHVNPCSLSASVHHPSPSLSPDAPCTSWSTTPPIPPNLNTHPSSTPPRNELLHPSLSMHCSVPVA